MSAEGAVARREALARARERLAPVLGPDAARRLRAFGDGGLYVDSTVAAALGAWIVDSLIVNGTAVALGVTYALASGDPDSAVGAVLITLALLVVLPLVYGWCYGDGRALGARLAGTRSVRKADGARIGLAKAGWAMLIRTLLLPFVFWVALGEETDIGEVRVSIDEAATRRLRESGVQATL